MGSKAQAPAPQPPAGFNRDTYLRENPDVAANWAGDPLEHYYYYGRNENRPGTGQPEPFDISSIFSGMSSGGGEPHGVPAPHGGVDPQLQANLQRRDQLLGGYMDAADAATDYINSQIEQERSNAALLGVEFTLDDAAKRTRINDYFSTLWGASDQRELEGMLNEFGAPEGFTGFTVRRGQGASPDAAATQQSISTSQGAKPKPTALTSDEDDILGGNAALGN